MHDKVLLQQTLVALGKEKFDEIVVRLEIAHGRPIRSALSEPSSLTTKAFEVQRILAASFGEKESMAYLKDAILQSAADIRRLLVSVENLTFM